MIKFIVMTNNPLCDGNSRKLCVFENCLKCHDKSFASEKTASMWSHKNHSITPRNVMKGSNKRYYFYCEICKHHFLASPNDIRRSKSKSKGCGYCSNTTGKLCENSGTTCTFCKDRSAASHPKSVNWSDKNSIKPHQISKGREDFIWFDCDKCGHDFESRLKDVMRGSWCPYCAKNGILCGKDNCSDCYNKSFASHDKSKNLLMIGGDLKAINIKLYSTITRWFECDNCPHSFEMIISNVSTGHWCPYCAKASSQLCDDENCIYCHNRSFASVGKSKYWSAKNKDLPRYNFKYSTNIKIFDCEYCGKEYEAALGNVTAGRWCSCRKHKTERKLKEILNDYNLGETKKDWCKNIETGRHLPFDVVIDDYNIIIELDGPHHFNQVSNWNSPEMNQERDIYKMRKAIENGYSIIRLIQKSVIKDDWSSNQLLKQIKIYDEPTIIYLADNNEYINHYMKDQKEIIITSDN